MEPKYNWVAVYRNGERFPQFPNPDSTDVENRYGDIRRDELDVFELYRAVPKVEKAQLQDKTVLRVTGTRQQLVLRCHIDAGAQLIYRRRVEMEQSTGKKEVVYLVGWQKNVKGRCVQAISVVFPDGHIETIGKWRQDRWNYNLVIHPWEGEKVV